MIFGVRLREGSIYRLLADEGHRLFPACATYPLRAECTSARRGRTITVHPDEALVQRARAEQTQPEWSAR